MFCSAKLTELALVSVEITNERVLTKWGLMYKELGSNLELDIMHLMWINGFLQYRKG